MQHCFGDLGSHFEALKSVLLIFFLVYASKKYVVPQNAYLGTQNSDVF
jgi:hypothetical protein